MRKETKDGKEVHYAIIKVSQRKTNMNREMFMTQSGEAVVIMHEAFRGIREGIRRYAAPNGHLFEPLEKVINPIKDLISALGGNVRRHPTPAKKTAPKKPPAAGRVDATAATPVLLLEEKSLAPASKESESESADDENEDDADESSQDEEEEDDDDEEEEPCNLAGCTRAEDDGAPPAAVLQRTAVVPLDVDDDDAGRDSSTHSRCPSALRGPSARG